MKDRIGTHLLAVSADSDLEVEGKLVQLKGYLKKCQSDGLDLTDVAFSINTSPEVRHSHRAVVIGKTFEELLANLESGNVIRGIVGANLPKICFLFSGLGSLYPKMGQQLNDTSPVFRNYVDIVEEYALAAYKDSNTEDQYSTLEEIAWVEPHKLDSPADSIHAHLRLNFILTKLWEYWGILPDVVLGASMGEFIAAHSAGITRLHDAIKTATAATELIFQCENGGMMALAVDEQRTIQLLDEFNNKVARDSSKWVEIANVNATYQTVVSLSAATIPSFRDFCTEKKVRHTLLPVASPFHSRALDPALNKFNEVMIGIKYYSNRWEYISSMTGQILDTQMDGLYWSRLIRSKIQFQKACKSAYMTGARTFLEIGSQPVLSALVAMNVDEIENSEPITCLPSLQKGTDDWTTLMITFGTLYTMGYSSNWHALYASYKPNKVIQPFHSVVVNKQLIGPGEIWESKNGETKSILNRHVVTRIIMEEVMKILTKSGRNVGDLITESSNFSELGLSSLQIVLMKNRLQELLGQNVNLKFSDLLGCTGVAELSDRICDKVEATAQGLERKMELEEIARTKELILRDMKLPKHIVRPDNYNTTKLKKLKSFLVTGITGNLCPYLVEWLLLNRKQQTDRLYCLVRGKNGRERMLEKFKFLEIKDSIDLSKIIIIEGDATKHRFGLDQETYDRLADECDAIINSAACTNHLSKYKDDSDPNGPRVVNVDGTVRILEFACHKRSKWLFNASTGMASTGTKGVYYEMAPEEWPHKGFEYILDHAPNIGYMISKSISDYMIFKASQRGIPAKVFRFPKIGNCKDVTTNHFIAKFLHFLLSGTLPQFDIPLQILSVRDCANISMVTFFNKKAAATDIYNVVSPYDISEMDLVSLGMQLGPSLRFMVEAVRVNSRAFGPDKPEVVARRDKLLATMEFLDRKYGKNWIDDPRAALKDETVQKLLKDEYYLKMQFVDYNVFIAKLEMDGLRSPLYPWLEFYNAHNAIYNTLNQRDVPEELSLPFLKHGVTAPDTFLRHMKLERLYPDEIFDMIEKPLEVVRKDIEYAINNAKKLFTYPF